jgi:phosphonate transport system substrate-binding protein
MKRVQPCSTTTAIWLVVLIGMLSVMACEGRDLESVGQPGTPVILLLSPFYGQNPQAVEQLVQYLRTATGLSFEVRIAPNEETAVRIAGTDQFDMGIMPLFDYLFCRHEYQVQGQLQILRADHSRTYTGQVVVLAGSPVESLEDLQGKRMGYVDSYSTSGFLFPASLLHGAGVTVEPLFLGSHEAVLAALREGTVDAAATYSEAVVSDSTLRAIATTVEIPNEPIFFRGGLSLEITMGIGSALLDYAATEAGRANLQQIGGITGLATLEDQDYESVAAMLEETGRSVWDLVPDGWWMYNQNRLTPAHYAP